MSSEGSLRVVVVEDHELIRRGLRELLDAEEAIQLVGEAGEAAGALDLVRQASPDVVVLDVRLPDGDGVELCREIRSLGVHLFGFGP